MRATGPPPRLGLVLVLDLARRRLLERDRQIVPAGNFDHRRRVLAVGALGERVVVGVYLAGPLGGDDHRGVVGICSFEKLVDSWLDHRPTIIGLAAPGRALQVPRRPSARRRSRSRGGTRPALPTPSRRFEDASRSPRGCRYHAPRGAAGAPPDPAA